MSNNLIADKLFFDNTDLDQSRLEKLVSDALKNADDGELFLEYRQSEFLANQRVIRIPLNYL